MLRGGERVRLALFGCEADGWFGIGGRGGHGARSLEVSSIDG